jgi:rhodanese-related sulfurtransferase
VSQANVTVHDIFTEELQAGLEDGSILLVDVREPHEFAAGHIPGAVPMPLSEFDPAELASDGKQRIVFSCRSGVRSIQALKLAQEAGLDLSEHYKPGLIGWVADGGEVA